MKSNITLKFLFFFSSFFLSNILKAQTNHEAKLLGEWAFEKYEFLDFDSDTSAMKRESKGLILSFEKGKKFTTKKKLGTVKKIVGVGTYTLSADGKYLYQNEQEVEIILLDRKVLVIKVPDAVIMHLRRLI